MTDSTAPPPATQNDREVIGRVSAKRPDTERIRLLDGVLRGGSATVRAVREHHGKALYRPSESDGQKQTFSYRRLIFLRLFLKLFMPFPKVIFVFLGDVG